MKNYPFYPKLSEEGEKESQKIINDFKSKISKIAEESIEKLYCDSALYIESDSWANFRNQIMDGFKNYNNSKIHEQYNFKAIRAEMFKDFREEIIVDLNQDIFNENEQLKKDVEYLKNEIQRIRNNQY